MKAYIKKTIIAFAIGLVAGSTFAQADMRVKTMKVMKGAQFNRRPASMDLQDARPIPSREIIATGNEAFATTETFAVRKTLIERVNQEMIRRGLEEDVDYAWIARGKNAVVNFVCYSTECNDWARRKLRTLAKVPKVREETDYSEAWKDPEIEKKANAPDQLSEEEQIRQRHMIHYKSLKQS